MFGYSKACIRLEEYQTAKAALEVGASLAVGDSRFTNLIKECDQGIAGNVVDCKPTPLEVSLSCFGFRDVIHLYQSRPGPLLCECVDVAGCVCTARNESKSFVAANN